jgi:hypothetical protein
MKLGSRFWRRTAQSFVGIMVLAGFSGLWLAGEHSIYDRLLTLWGVLPFRLPFLDVAGSLAAWDCARQGVDVIVADPCDILQRGYNYSPFWMTIDWIPLGLADRVWVGLVLNLVFLMSLAALPPPLSRGETMLRIAAIVSTMVVFAVERANPDILIFVMTLVSIDLLRRSFVARMLGQSIIFLMGLIKYYPFIVSFLVIKERLRVLILFSVVYFFGLFLFVYFYFDKILEGIFNIPGGSPFVDMIGAQNLPLGLLATPAEPAAETVAHMIALMIAVLVVIVWMMAKLWQTSDVFGTLRRLDEPRRLALFAGALLLSGCFFAGQSIGYRGIFLLLILPGLYALGRDKTAGPVGHAAWLAAIGIPPLMWAESIRLWIHLAITGHYPPPGFRSLLVLDQPLDFLAWLVREVAWWLLVALLITLLVAYLADRVPSWLGLPERSPKQTPQSIGATTASARART